MEVEMIERQKQSFQKGKIYIIRNRINDLVYIGSTCQSLAQRMVQHRRDMNVKRCQDWKLYQLMKELHNENFYIELLENYPCNTKDELNKREGEFIRKYQSQLNKRIEGRTPKEYREEHKEEATQYHKEYQQNNKEKLLEYQKEYREKNKDKAREYNKDYQQKNKERLTEYSKEYRETHKEQISQCKSKIYEKIKDKYSEHKKQYRQQNKDKIAERDKKYRELIEECEVCKCQYKRCHRSDHIKTKKHINNLNKKQIMCDEDLP